MKTKDEIIYDIITQLDEESEGIEDKMSEFELNGTSYLIMPENIGAINKRAIDKALEEGIKLGEEKAKREFLEWLIALISHSKEHNCIMVKEKIKELQKSEGGKE